MPTKIQKLTTISTLATIALTAALISPQKLRQSNGAIMPVTSVEA